MKCFWNYSLFKMSFIAEGQKPHEEIRKLHIYMHFKLKEYADIKREHI